MCSVGGIPPLTQFARDSGRYAVEPVADYLTWGAESGNSWLPGPHAVRRLLQQYAAQQYAHQSP